MPTDGRNTSREPGEDLQCPLEVSEATPEVGWPRSPFSNGAFFSNVVQVEHGISLTNTSGWPSGSRVYDVRNSTWRGDHCGIPPATKIPTKISGSRILNNKPTAARAIGGRPSGPCRPGRFAGHNRSDRHLSLISTMKTGGAPVCCFSRSAGFGISLISDIISRSGPSRHSRIYLGQAPLDPNPVTILE